MYPYLASISCINILYPYLVSISCINILYPQLVSISCAMVAFLRSCLTCVSVSDTCCVYTRVGLLYFLACVVSRCILTFGTYVRTYVSYVYTYAGLTSTSVSEVYDLLQRLCVLYQYVAIIFRETKKRSEKYVPSFCRNACLNLRCGFDLRRAGGGAQAPHN